MPHPKLIFGTANFGTTWTDPTPISTLAQTLKHHNITHIDTAARYPGTHPGLSQKTLGANDFAAQGFTIDTKILAFTPTGAGEMAPAAIRKSLSESLASLRMPRVNVLYSHRMDPETPLGEQARAVDALRKASDGFAEFGVANWPVAAVEEYVRVVEEEGGMKPSVGQYQYNVLARGLEADILPCLRRHGMRLVAFSPLAGGFLTGKVTVSQEGGGDDRLKGSRFEVGNPAGAGYRHWYDHGGMHAAVNRLTVLCAEYEVSLPDASFRWLAYHSALGQEDAILMGASKVKQVEDAANAIAAGPLPDGLVKGMNEVWELCKDDAEAIVSF